ncbi:unnamed protein product [Prorocentrum cordatum]|uniref:Uncharacterized protein n=1 Tax=Prorocentrum cordatum TaxID=2364126 RepID=A0ABN9UL30_9DINO|nr:unnamed protein product [Polarella glacialis]
MTGAADARDAGACSPPRRDGAPSAVSTGDQSAATAAQADAWRAKLAEELGEWSWPERCLGRGYCIEVLVTEDGSTDAAQGRWVDAVPQQRVVDEAGRDAYLCAEYEWDSDTYREDFGPERVRPAGSLYSVYEQLRRQRARERGRAKPKPRPKPVVAPDKLLPQGHVRARAGGWNLWPPRRLAGESAAAARTMLGGSSLHDRAKRDAALSPGCALQLRDCGNMQRWSNVRP